MLYIREIQDLEGASPSEKNKLLHDYAYSLLFEGLRKDYGIIADESSIERSEKGKPFLKNTPVCFSVSHTDGLAVCLISTKPCGADCEYIRKYNERVARRCLTESERTAAEKDPRLSDQYFTAFWTLKEAYVKALGVGIGYGLKNISFDLCGDKIISAEDKFTFVQYRTEKSESVGGYIVSVCCENAEDSELSPSVSGAWGRSLFPF
ncbi:MAG: 4'-phosphopantetheinyl transferase family protein [Huintestinicola sp.]